MYAKTKLNVIGHFMCQSDHQRCHKEEDWIVVLASKTKSAPADERVKTLM